MIAVGPRDRAHLVYGQIFLTNVYAVGPREYRDICPVVDDDPRALRSSERNDPFREIEEAAARTRLVAQLQKARAASHAGLGDTQWLEPTRGADVGVDDGVEDRGLEKASS